MNKQYNLHLCVIVFIIYIEKKSRYFSWILIAMPVEVKIWSEYFTSDNIWFLCTTHIMLSCTPEKYTELTWYVLTSKASSSEISRQKICDKIYQYEERYNHLKFHI